MLWWSYCPWVTSVHRIIPNSMLITDSVLFNGLGSHITMIPAKNLVVYFQVRNATSCTKDVHWLKLDRIFQQLCIHRLHCLYQILNPGPLQAIVRGSIHESCSERNVWLCVSLGRGCICCRSSYLHPCKQVLGPVDWRGLPWSLQVLLWPASPKHLVRLHHPRYAYEGSVVIANREVPESTSLWSVHARWFVCVINIFILLELLLTNISCLEHWFSTFSDSKPWFDWLILALISPVSILFVFPPGPYKKLRF